MFMLQLRKNKKRKRGESKGIYMPDMASWPEGCRTDGQPDLDTVSPSKRLRTDESGIRGICMV